MHNILIPDDCFQETEKFSGAVKTNPKDFNNVSIDNLLLGLWEKNLSFRVLTIETDFNSALKGNW